MLIYLWYIWGCGHFSVSFLKRMDGLYSCEWTFHYSRWLDCELWQKQGSHSIKRNYVRLLIKTFVLRDRRYYSNERLLTAVKISAADFLLKEPGERSHLVSSYRCGIFNTDPHNLMLKSWLIMHLVQLTAVFLVINYGH